MDAEACVHCGRTDCFYGECQLIHAPWSDNWTPDRRCGECGRSLEIGERYYRNPIGMAGNAFVGLAVGGCCAIGGKDAFGRVLLDPVDVGLGKFTTGDGSTLTDCGADLVGHDPTERCVADLLDREETRLSRVVGWRDSNHRYSIRGGWHSLVESAKTLRTRVRFARGSTRKDTRWQRM